MLTLVLASFLSVSSPTVVEAVPGRKEFYFKSLEVEDGLSQNSIYDIIQDSKGRIWAATGDGISIYNGYSFKTLNLPASDNKKGSNAAINLLQSYDEKVYICSTGQLFVYDPVYEKMSPVQLLDEDGKPIDGDPRSIKMDYIGNVWVAVSNYGLIKIGRDGSHTTVPFKSLDSPSMFILRSIYFAQDGNIWIASSSHGLLRYSPATNELNEFSDGFAYPFKDIWAIAPLDNNTLFVSCATEGLFTFDLRTHEFSRYRAPDGSTVAGTLVHDIFTDSQKRTWICSENGLYIFSEGGCTHAEYDPNNRFSISDNAVFSICEDNEGGIWAGTFFGGLNYSSASGSVFRKYFPGTGDNRISGKSVSEICPDKFGNLWIGTEDAGLNRYDSKTGTFSNGFIDALNVHALHFVDENELWIGTYASGLYVRDTRNGRTRKYEASSKPGSLIDNRIYSIYRDYHGNIWIGTQLGLCRYEKETDSFKAVRKGEINTQVNDIIQDIDGNIWFAVIGKGIVKYNPVNDSWEDIDFTRAITFLMDKDYNIWVGTEGNGLYMYDSRKKAFTKHFDESDGLPNNIIYKILEDNDSNIWCSTNKGIFRLTPKDRRITCFDSKSGLPGNQFNYKSGLKLPNGNLLFGGVKGLVSFDPQKIKASSSAPQILFTDFLLFNERVIPGENDSPLKKSILYTDRITLKHNQSVFTIRFSIINYSGIGGGKFYYCLKGLQNEWTNFDMSSAVTYSELSPGEYVFCVKAESDDDSWPVQESSIAIKVLPPWYKSMLAYILYIVAILFSLFSIVRLILYYSKKQNERLIEKMQREKEEELQNSKIEFFTNITHEIKTPLTLISIPMEEVMKNIDKKDANYENLSIIRRNTNRLLKLVNELLNFRKIDPKGTQPNYRPTDVRIPIKETCSRFVPSATIKGIELQEDLPDTALEVDLDEDIFTKILSNLLNNALKHAEKTISVHVSELEQTFRLTVSNDGDRIPESEAEHIFQPFVKLESNTPGTGIGLAFARNLAEAHRGTISLDTTASDVTFVLELPIKQDNALRTVKEWREEEMQENAVSESGNDTDGNKSRSILIVEDNIELLNMLTAQFEKGFNILRATNGKEALKALEGKQVDIIISDVMMPEMTGLELCSHIKEDINTSHIPIVLLTAISDSNSQIEALGLGADDYITKPFSIDILKARVNNLLLSREKIRSTFIHSPSESLSTITHSKTDEQFLERIQDYINSHIEEEIEVEDIALAMNISRATLYRKLKGVTELSPNDFVKLCRLRKAAELLKGNEYRINEVAYLVGFNSTSYFTKCFSKQFGVLPKDYK